MTDVVEAATGSGGPQFRVDTDTSTGGSVNWPVTKVVFGTEGAYNYAATGNGLPVQGTVSLATGGVVGLAGGTATVGTVALQGSAAVALNAGTATVGTVALQSNAAVALNGGTATVGSVAAITAAVGLAAGTATIGTVALQGSAAVALNAGTATVGSIAAITAAVGLAAGTATVGTVALQSGAAVALNAGTATVGSVVGIDQSNTMYSGTGAVTPKFAAISITASGDTSLVTGVTNKKIRVLAVHMMNGGAGNLRLESGAGGTALTGVMPLASTSGSGYVLPYNKVGWYETTGGAALSAEWDASPSIGGSLTYIEAT